MRFADRHCERDSAAAGMTVTGRFSTSPSGLEGLMLRDGKFMETAETPSAGEAGLLPRGMNSPRPHRGQ
jgi:hypothetical protein